MRSDWLPSDVAFAEFLNRTTPTKARRDIRPKLSPAEVRILRVFKPPKPRGGRKFSMRQMEIAMAAIRSERQQEAS